MATGFSQRFKGKILISLGSLFQAGKGGLTCSLQGQISKQFAPLAIAATGILQTLMSYALPGNSFSQNGAGIFVRTWGTFANNANAKTIQLVIGGVSLVSGASSTQANVSWEMSATYLRSGAAQQQAFFGGNIGTVGISKSAIADTANDQAAITIAQKATGVSQSDVIQNGMLVEFFNA